MRETHTQTEKGKRVRACESDHRAPGAVVSMMVVGDPGAVGAAKWRGKPRGGEGVAPGAMTADSSVLAGWW